MKGRGMRCLRIVLLMAVMVVVVCGASRAQIGHWQITYATEGSSDWWVTGSVGGTTPWMVPPLPIAIARYLINKAAWAHAHGWIEATLEWVDDAGDPAPDPPAEVYVLEKATASWVDMNHTSSPTPIGTASNGLGGPYVVAPDQHSGESSGSRLTQRNGSTGRIVLPRVTLNARVDVEISQTGGTLQALCTYSVLLTAPADDYQFESYPNPPPAGTTPYALNAANRQKGPLADGTGYFVEGRVYTNQTAAHALAQLRSTAVLFVFGHGGSAMQSAQTFWDGTNWHVMVQTATARNAMQNQHGIPLSRIVWLDDPAIPNDAFQKVLLAVFEGCWTAYVNSWGSPAHGVKAKGAECTLGFTTTIYSHEFLPGGGVDPDKRGAEEWADRFWQELNEGQTVAKAEEIAGSITPPSKGLRNTKILGADSGTTLRIHPARYGNGN
jgi:hypothetical protein